MAIAKKKQKFFDVEMPLLKKTTQLYAFEIEELKGRIIRYDLTRILRGKNAILTLNVELEKEGPSTSPREFRILPTFLRKMVRKGTSYVEDSFTTECTDAKVTIKPFLIARRKVSRAVRKALRENAREELVKYANTRSSEDLFKDILKNQLQKPLSLKLKKTYPLSLCEIRVLKVGKKLENKKTDKKNKPKEPKEITIKEDTPKEEKIIEETSVEEQ